MSYRPPPPEMNSKFPSRFNNNFTESSDEFVRKPSNNYQANTSSNFPSYNNRNPPNISQNLSFTTTGSLPPMHYANNPNPTALPPNQFYKAPNPEQQTVNGITFPYQSSTNNLLVGTQNSGSVYPNFGVPYNQYYPNPVQQNTQRHPIVHSTQVFNYPAQNIEKSNQPPVAKFEKYQTVFSQNTPISNASFNNPQSSLTENVNNYNSIHSTRFPVNNSVISPSITNNQASLPVNNNNFSRIPNVFSNFPPDLPTQWKESFPFSVPPPTLQIVASSIPSQENVVNNVVSEKEQKLVNFLQKYSSIRKKNEKRLAVPEYRSKLIAAFSIMNLLIKSKSKLQSLLDANESVWNSEMQYINHQKKQLSELCSFINSDDNLSSILKKLKYIKRKRNQKKKTKLNKLSEKIKAEQNRKELNQQIDKWLDDIKEKNLKLKREVEMKKEADFILLEVRRKIQEANRTIEKIKVLEKLRYIRQTNAVQKGLHVQPEHDENFHKKMSHLKETMLRQLADYTAEEKALKVMLETEQEGQREEIVQWEIKKIKTMQQKRQKHIIECLFGNSEDPLPTDHLYLFHKYHTSANNSIERLAQIRHQWDVHLAEDGETVPQQWVVPGPPSISVWEKCLISSRS